jgi:3-deoxy-D-manno-octulosonic-acid transferase
MKSSMATTVEAAPVAEHDLPAVLRTYRLLTIAAAPLARLLLSYRLKRGKENAKRLPERLGMSKLARPPGSLIWIHGASVGELTAVLPLIQRIRERDFNVLVTTGTVTSAELAERRLPAEVIHQFVPLDTPRIVARFLDHWQPDLALFVESDLWPNLVVASADRNIPLIVVNGRVSERSFRRWRFAPNAITALLTRFDLCLAQSTANATRYAALGAPRISTTGNLKLDSPAPPVNADTLAAFKSATAGRTIIAATSTHAGEETAMINAHRRLKATNPGLLTVIAPRHPERGPGILEIVSASGLTAAVRSRGELPRPSIDIYIADTLGELGLIYRLAPIVFIGGSLVGHGGQNPVEAARLGAAILHGPHVWNFTEIYNALDAAGGAELVVDTTKLAPAIDAWLQNADARQKAADTALKAMDTLAGALDRTLAALDPYFMHLRLDRRSNNA